jgi:protein tyrosine/serine phosphatase
MIKKVLGFFTIFSLLGFMACDDNDEKSTEIGYSGKDISDQVEITRDAETKNAVLSVKTDNEWALYAGSVVGSIDITQPLLTGTGKGEVALTLDTDKRYFFQFGTKEGQVLVSEKRLPIKGGYNFRDMGGVKNKDNKFVCWGSLFRTDEMNKLTDEDLIYIASTKLLSVVDFRTTSEKEGAMGGLVPAAPDKLAATVKNTYDLPISAGNIFSDEVMTKIRQGATIDDLTEVMKNSYIELVTKDEYVTILKEFFSYIQNESNLPLSFHCSAGKDRAGVAAMLIYSALDVDKDIIVADYMLSKQYIAGKYDMYLKIYPSIAPLVTVDESYLEAAYVAIDEKYGSMNKFLTETLNIDINKMKKLYLY